MPIRTDLPELADLLPTADVVDVKTATGTVTLREFVAGTLGSSPLWIKALFAVRIVVAKALRLDTAWMPPQPRLRPVTVSFPCSLPAPVRSAGRSGSVLRGSPRRGGPLPPAEGD